jgi:hypothetical protein
MCALREKLTVIVFDVVQVEQVPNELAVEPTSDCAVSGVDYRDWCQ